MKNTILLIVVMFTLSILSTGSRAVDLVDYGMIGGISEEGLFKIDLPIAIANKEITELLLKEGSPFKKINYIKLDPIKRTLALKADIELPSSLLFTLDEKAGHSIRKIHNIETVIVFPSPSLLSVSKYVQFKINKLVFDGVDYSNAFHIVSRIVPAIMLNKSFINYFIAEDKTQINDEKTDVANLIKDLFESKTIVMRDNTISFKFNLHQFPDLKRYSYLSDLRLWHFSPVLIKGTEDRIMFRIEAGLGKPGKNWISSAKERQDNDITDLKKIRESLYKKYQFNNNIEKELITYINEFINKSGISNWNMRADREIEDLKQSIISKARTHLSLEDDLFVSDPAVANFEFISEAKVYIQSTLFDIKQRFILDEEKFSGGLAGIKKPIFTQRFSQNTINQFTNYFRDFEFDKEQLFQKLNIVLAPHLPGLVIKGEVNLNINSLLAMGLDESGIEFSSDPLRLDSSTYGKSLPFEISIYTYMQDLSIMELDIRSATIGEGLGRVSLLNNAKNGDFLIEFTKMTIVNILKSFLMNDPLAVASTDAPSLDEEQLRQILFSKIKKHNNNIKALKKDPNANFIDELITIKEIDLQNPFNEVPAQIAKQKSVEFFRNLLGYDDQTGRILLRLDPSLISEKILMSKNTISLWNFEPLFDKQMDKTFLEISAGDGVRSKEYLKKLKNRSENLDSQLFSGTSGDMKNEGVTDYNLNLSFTEFQNTTNKILSEAIRPHSMQKLAQLEEAQEGQFNIIEDITLTAAQDNKLDLAMTLLSVEKSKLGFIRSFFSKEDFQIKKERSRINARVKITAEDLEIFKKAILKKNPNEVFLGDTLLKIDLDTVGRTIENPSILGRVMNSVIGEVNLNNSFLGANLKSMILRVAGGFLNERGENSGNTVIAGFHINKYLKVFTHDKEILIQINPRFAGPVWDFYIAQNKTSNSRNVGIVINKQENTISFDFKSAFSLATVDKISIYKIMLEASKLTKNLSKLDQKNILGFYDKIFYSSDKTKRSLHHQFKDIVNNYDDIINLALNSEVDEYNLTSAGAELMHIAVAAKSLSNLFEKYISLNIVSEMKYRKDMISIQKELNDKYVLPLMKLYKSKYYTNNQKIIESEVNDWNHLIYPDAIFSQKAFDYITN